MTNSTNQATAEATQSVSDNISFEELVARRIGREVAPETEEESEEEVVDADDAELASLEDGDDAEESTEESDDESEETPEEHEEIDLLSLSTEQIQELAKKGKSRLLQRIGELTAQKRSLEEKLAAQPLPAPLANGDRMPDDIQAIGDLNALKSFHEEMARTLEMTDDILDEHQDYADDDIIVVGDKEFPKSKIRLANRNSKKAITKYIPARQQEIAKVAEYGVMEKQYLAAAQKEVPDITDETSEIGKNYKALISDPLISKIKRDIPEIGIQIEYILAHASKSIFGGKVKSIQTGAGNKLKVSPPASPVGSGSLKINSSSKAKTKDAYHRFESTGSVEDWVASRIARMK